MCFKQGLIEKLFGDMGSLIKYYHQKRFNSPRKSRNHSDSYSRRSERWPIFAPYNNYVIDKTRMRNGEKNTLREKKFARGKLA
jgi:hypothetical protein